MRHLILSLAAVVMTASSIPAQGTSTPGLPRREESEGQALVWKEVSWAFPRPGIETKEVKGVTLYKVGKDTFGVVDTYNSKPIRIIFIPDNVRRAAEFVHLQDPKGMPDVDKFLTALAVMQAVETPENYDNEYLGDGPFEGRTMYLYKTKSGANVGAMTSSDRTMVVVSPAPSIEKK